MRSSTETMPENPRFAPTTLGARLRERDQGWFGVTEVLHRPNDVLRPHAHRYPAVTIVREGSFGLRIGTETVDCNQRGLFFKRGEHVHSNVVGHGGSHSLILEIRSDEGRVAERGLPLPSESFWTGDPRALHLAARIEAEFRSVDIASNLALEGLVLELVAALLRRSVGRSDAGRPPWLAEVEALLHEHFREPLGLGDVAEAIGLHPVHLARTFRRHHGCSLGEYLRRVRLEDAARALRGTDRPIGEIALETGFYDQAHFCRCFKKEMSVPPSVYRASLRR